MSYQNINSIVADIDIDLSAAQSHGMAAGMLCVNDRTKPGYWLQELTQDADAIDEDDKNALVSLFEETRRLLASDDFSFELLLPGEDTALNGQLEALREWCQGFLYGIGSATSAVGWSKDSQEIVKDIAEFTKLDNDAQGEEAENDFMELTEYLRASVIFLRTELNRAAYKALH